MKISRRALLRASAGGAIAANYAFAARAKTSDKPNFIFIMADDLGYADVSCYGRRDYTTRNIDKLAAQGLRFVQGYANSPVCSATRTALITGRYQYRLPVGLEEPLGRNPGGLPPEHPTLPSLLKKQGYSSTLIGKWHLGALPDYGPLQSGYDRFFGLRGAGVDYFSHTYNNQHDLWDQNVPVHRTGYVTDLLGDRAVEEIATYARSKQPFLISLHFTAPHWPWEGPNDQAESERLKTVKGGLQAHDAGTQKTYAEMVLRMDMQIGRLLDALDKHRLANNTLVVFTSDNGGERFSDTWPFTGKKTELLEGGLRIPAIVRWPARVRRGVTHDQVMMSMDWMPTFLDAAGGAADVDHPFDGVSLLDALARNAPPMPRTLFWRYKSHSQEAVRDGDWKYLKIRDNTFLFNVVDDPLERANWKERDPQRYQEIVAKYHAWNATMLPLDPKSATYGYPAADMADHYGGATSPPSGAAPRD